MKNDLSLKEIDGLIDFCITKINELEDYEEADKAKLQLSFVNQIGRLKDLQYKYSLLEKEEKLITKLPIVLTYDNEDVETLIEYANDWSLCNA